MRRRLSPMRPREVMAILERVGWYVDHTTGGHYIMRHPDKHGLVPIPYHGHRDLKVGLLRSIIRQAGMTLEEFLSEV